MVKEIQKKAGKKQGTKGLKSLPPALEKTKFKKGQSGNPKGYTKGVPNRATVLKEFLSLIAKDEKGNKTKHPYSLDKNEVTQYELVIAALIEKAKAGDVHAIKEIQDTVYGKLKSDDDLTIKGAIEHIETKKVDLSKITSDELKKLDTILSKAVIKTEK